MPNDAIYSELEWPIPQISGLQSYYRCPRARRIVIAVCDSYVSCSVSDVVVEARPWPRGAPTPFTFMALALISKVQALAFALRAAMAFLPHDAMHKRGLWRRAVGPYLSVRSSVCLCLSVRPSGSWILSKQLNISIKKNSSSSSHTIPFFIPNVTAIFTGTPVTEASNAGGVTKNRAFRWISGSMTAAVRRSTDVKPYCTTE